MQDSTTPAAAKIGVVMGSDSDWPTLQAAAKLLEEFGVAFEARVVSAHRTPQRLYDYATGAAPSVEWNAEDRAAAKEEEVKQRNNGSSQRGNIAPPINR